MKSRQQGTQGRKGECVVRLDRIRVVGGRQWKDKPPSLRGFRVIRDSFVRQQTSTRTYLRCRQFISDTTGTRVYWQYSAQRRWLRPWRLTFIGDDRAGLARRELSQVLALCPGYVLVLVEMAFDFGVASGVDQDFVRRRALFGKSRPTLNRGGRGQLRYGTRNSAKLVRAYLKPEINSYRVEVEFHSKILRSKLVDVISDLPGLSASICPAHFRFVAVRWAALRKHLRRRAADARLFERAQEQSASIHKTMRLLRRSGVNNPGRFLAPTKKNALIQNAAQTWAETFQEVANEK